MTLVKKITMVTTATVLAVGLLGAPATAKDSSWGCGGCVSKLGKAID